MVFISTYTLPFEVRAVYLFINQVFERRSPRLHSFDQDLFEWMKAAVILRSIITVFLYYFSFSLLLQLFSVLIYV